MKKNVICVLFMSVAILNLYAKITRIEYPWNETVYINDETLKRADQRVTTVTQKIEYNATRSARVKEKTYQYPELTPEEAKMLFEEYEKEYQKQELEEKNHQQ